MAADVAAVEARVESSGMAVRVKICGIKDDQGLFAAVEARADLIGFVFFPPSPRHISLEDAAPLAAYVRGIAASVALVVDADDDLIDRIVAEVGPDMLQLHGSETPERVAEVRRRTGRPVMKAIKVETRADAEAARLYAGVADLILFDAKPPKDATRPGGHGVTFDWALLDGLAAEVAFMLSGGLTPGNVAEAIRRTGAAAVDVSSGVEDRPGVKSPELIRRFVQAAKGAKQAIPAA
jgi:phosphoribosylanthranilate isomerase